MFRDLILFFAFCRSYLLQRLLLLALLWSWGALQAAVPASSDPVLQFTAAGHVVGFQPDGVYVASGDHMMHVGFVGTKGAKPEAARPPDKHKAVPLTQVYYSDLWPGIDLRYEASGGGIVQSTWTIRSGADPNRIRLRYNKPLVIAADGSLKIQYETGWMQESAPIAWQEIEGQHRPVSVAFRLMQSPQDEPVLGFEVGHYHPGYPLLIDPTLAWNTFLGSKNLDAGEAVAVDGNGHVYVTGLSRTTWGTPLNAFAGGRDAFVAKLDANGVRQWHTFLGSGDFDRGNAIAVDGSGNIYVTGESDATWGTPLNAHAGGGGDAFVAKLAANGVLQWNTFLGSADFDRGNGITVDGSGNIHVTGESNATWGTPLNAHAGSYDAFVAKLAANGVLQWNTFLGSAGFDVVEAIAVDSGGAVYVAGASDATWGTPLNAHEGNYDAFVAKLAANGVLQWNTFLGSADLDRGNGITVDGNGNVYVVGDSGATWGTPLNAHAGVSDAFVARLAASGVLQWNTFLGSVDFDGGDAIAVNGGGNIYVTGESDATWGTPQTAHVGSGDAFVAKLAANGVLQWNSFLGSVDFDRGNGITVDGNGNVYVVGDSDSTWGAPLNAHAGGDGPDAFVAKFRSNGCTFYIIKSKNGKAVAVCL